MKSFCLIILLCCTAISGRAQWNPNTFVNLAVSDNDASDLQTATTSDGKTWIAFYSLNSVTGNYDMRAQLLDELGNKLLGSNGVLVSNQPSGSAVYVFNVCTDLNNNLVIGYQIDVGGEFNVIVAKVNIDGSLPWGDGVVIGLGLSPYPAVNSFNEVVVAWNNSSPSTLYMQKISSAGLTMWASPVPVTVGTSLTTRGQIVTHADGNFTMVFHRKSFGINSTLYAQRYNSAGVPLWPAPLQISNLSSAAIRYYSILKLGDVTYFGYYVSSGSRFSSFLQKINPNGTLPWGINGSPFSTYAGSADPVQQTTGIAYENGSSFIWGACTYSDPGQTEYGVYVQKFDTATGAVQLNPLGKQVYAIGPNRDTYVGGIHVFNSGPVFMSYDVNYKIYATRLNANGDFVWPGNRVELSSTTATLALPKGRYSFAGIVSGQAVAVWTEDRGSGGRAYAQNITAAGPLPVTWSDFSGVNRNDEAFLYWTTSSENNNLRFDVERSNDGRVFKSIGSVNSRGNEGNSSVPLNYNFIDKKPEKGENFYRLRQIDFDGRFSFSPIIRFRFGKESGIRVGNPFPVPASDRLNIPVFSGSQEDVQVVMYDMSGKALSRHKEMVVAGESRLILDVGSLPSGSYTIKLFGAGGKNLFSGICIKP